MLPEVSVQLDELSEIHTFPERILDLAAVVRA
jgi:hypothetical protein